MSRAPRLRPKRAPAMTVTGTAELVLAPQVRRFAARLYIGAAIVVLILMIFAFGAVRYLAVVEPMLAAEGSNAQRAIAYELPVGAELHVPIEPNTDLLRFVVHAYGKSDMALTPHPARLDLFIKGEKRKRTEEVRMDPPGLRSRVTPESQTTGVGDPIPFEVDVHDAGVGELVVKLAEIKGADGLLVRAYRREQLSDSEVALRDTALDRTKKDDLAKWTWELGWDELGPTERVALLQARWRRIGALRGASADLRSMTIAVAPPPLRESPPMREELLGRVALRGDEEVAMILHANAKVRFLSDEATVLTATWRDLEGNVSTRSAPGSLEVGPFDGPRSVELRAARDVLLEVRSPNANEVEWLGYAAVWRTSPTRPVMIDSPDQERVVRVGVRKPMPRSGAGQAKLGVTVEITGAGFTPTTHRWTGEKPRSRVDRYEDFDSPEAPSERAQFFITLPRGTHAKVTAQGGEPLDISLSELDASMGPMPMPERPPETPAPALIAETEDMKSAWVPRRPSNAIVFDDENAHKTIRTAHWYAPAPPPPPPGTAALGHWRHPNVDKTEKNGRLFDGITKPFDMEVDARRPLFVPIIAQFDVPTKVTVRIETGGATRMLPALYQRWTLPRTMDVGPKELRATFVIGDDIPSNAKVHLRITSETQPTRGVHQLVSLPWQAVATGPKRAEGPRWLNGAFEE